MSPLFEVAGSCGGMDPTLTTIATWLETTGPYGMLAALAWAFWRTNERKDRAIEDLYRQLAETTRLQNQTALKVDESLDRLGDAIERLGEHRGRE